MSQRRPNMFQDHPAKFVEARALGQDRAYCEHVEDGDSYDFWIDVGYGDYSWRTIRLRNFDAPETKRPRNKLELEHGIAARARAVELISRKHTMIQSFINSADKEDITLSRYEADVWFWFISPQGSFWRSLALILTEEGFAKRDLYV